MARGPTLQALQERLQKLRGQLELAVREVEKIRAQEALLLDMLREARGEPSIVRSAPRPNVKGTVLSLLEEVGENGLNASMAVELALKRGITLERGTVSSLLSRLKNEGLVSYGNNLYRLTVLSEPSVASMNVTTLKPKVNLQV